jgi:hypothetical protein
VTLGQSTLSLRRHRPGGVRERPNRHDWKSCVAQVTVGSNPTLSATKVLVRALRGLPADRSAGPLTAN